MIEVCTTFMLKISDGYTLCTVSGRVSHTLWIRQISGDMRCPGRRFHHQAKLLTTGYTACSVNGVLGFIILFLTELLLHYISVKKTDSEMAVSYPVVDCKPISWL